MQTTNAVQSRSPCKWHTQWRSQEAFTAGVSRLRIILPFKMPWTVAGNIEIHSGLPRQRLSLCSSHSLIAFAGRRHSLIWVFERVKLAQVYAVRVPFFGSRISWWLWDHDCSAYYIERDLMGIYCKPTYFSDLTDCFIGYRPRLFILSFASDRAYLQLHSN